MALGRDMKEDGFSNWTLFRVRWDNCKIASGQGKKENKPKSSGFLLRDSQRAPHGPAASGSVAVGWRDPREIPETLPMHSQPTRNVVAMRAPLNKCHRESGETIELHNARLCKMPDSRHYRILNGKLICARLARGRGTGAAPWRLKQPCGHSKRGAEQASSLLQNVWGGSLRARAGKTWENQAECHKFRNSKEKV